MKADSDHITVCICTYKRPLLLERLLVCLVNQAAPNFVFSIVVVDNDCLQSAMGIVPFFCKNYSIDIAYICEPDQNISLARNRAVRHARGSYIAMIDDDECPGYDWLQRMYGTCKEHDSDGVLGPVDPQYEVLPPQWILKGRLHERKKFKTGETIRDPRDARTGNVLFASKIFEDLENPFDPQYGRSGGEDTNFFRRMMEKGHLFVWCNEAPVYENIPPERMKRSYFLKRALLRGVVSARSQPFNVLSIAKSFIAFPLYVLALPLLQLAGHHYFMRYLVKSCDHIGKILAIFGIDVIEERAW